MTSELLDRINATLPKLEGWCSPEKAEWFSQIVLEEKPALAVEIGVFGGSSLIPIALAMQAAGAGHLYGIDPWSTEQAVAGMIAKEHRDWWGKVNMKLIYAGCRGQIKRLGLSERVTLLQETSDQAASRFTPETIGLLHLDGNHSAEQSLRDVQTYLPLVKPGGAIAFDDTNWMEDGVVTTKAALEFLEQHCDFEGIINACALLRKR